MDGYINVLASSVGQRAPTMQICFLLLHRLLLLLCLLVCIGRRPIEVVLVARGRSLRRVFVRALHCNRVGCTCGPTWLSAGNCQHCCPPLLQTHTHTHSHSLTNTRQHGRSLVVRKRVENEITCCLRRDEGASSWWRLLSWKLLSLARSLARLKRKKNGVNRRAGSLLAARLVSQNNEDASQDEDESCLMEAQISLHREYCHCNWAHTNTHIQILEMV